MSDFWWQMGVMRWPLAFSLTVVTVLGAWSALRVFEGGRRIDATTKALVDAILFWGGFALLTGVLGTVVGVSVAAMSIEAAGAINPSLIWGGIRVALSTTVFGMLIMAWAALIWFVLQLRWRLLEAKAMESA
jgi:hypothetical protein